MQSDKGFDQETFEKQMSVMRGQVSTCKMLQNDYKGFGQN